MSLNRNTSPCGQLSFCGLTLYKKQISSHLHVPFSPRDITETSVICRQQESPIHLFMYQSSTVRPNTHVVAMAATVLWLD